MDYDRKQHKLYVCGGNIQMSKQCLILDLNNQDAGELNIINYQAVLNSLFSLFVNPSFASNVNVMSFWFVYFTQDAVYKILRGLMLYFRVT